MERYFNYGDIKNLAKAAKVSPGFVSKLLRRERRAKPIVAEALAVECARLGYDVSREDWSNPQWSKHEAFRAFEDGGVDG